MSLPLKDKRAVLFDMDGVLYDSMPMHAKAWCRSLAEFGYTMTTDDVYANEGCTGAHTIRMISQREGRGPVSDEDARRIYERKAELFHGFGEAPMMPGAYEVMERARSMDMLIEVVTGSGQPKLIERVQRDYEGFVFRDLMVTAFDVERGKPNPEPYLKGLEIGGITAEEAVVVENAPLGIRAARAAGIDTIAVNTGPLDDEVLLREGPVVLFHSMFELSVNWNRIMGRMLF